MTNVALFVFPLKMSTELIDVIKQLTAECAGGVEEDEIAVFAELALLDVALIRGLRVKDLL